MDRLQTKREVTRAELRHISEEFERLITAEAVNGDKVEEIHDLLQGLARDLSGQDALIEPHITSEDLADEYQAVREHQSTIIRMRTRIERVRQSLIPHQPCVTTPPRPTAATEARSAHVKLPKLELQRFTGNLAEWRPFWEQYEQAIHDNSALSNAEKLLYLRSVLSGSAASAVAGIQATEDNYNVIIDILKRRFGNTDVLIQEHLTQLLGLPTVRHAADVNGLRQLYDHLRTNIAALQSLGVGSDSYGPMLCSALLRMLPTDCVVEYHKSEHSSQAQHNGPNLDRVLSFLQKEVMSREKARQVSSASRQGRINSDKGHHPFEKKGKPLGGSAAALVTASHLKRSERCAFCSAQHDAEDCTATLTVEERRKRLRDHLRCFRCAKQGHRSKECRNKRIRCSTCGGRHITPMCDPTWTTQTSVKTVELHATAGKPDGKRSGVVLQTAQVWVEGQQRRRLARCLFDGGSQRTFVTERLSRELRLEVLGEEEVTIYPFGGSAHVTKDKHRRVKIWLRSQYSRKEHCVEALEIKEICSDHLAVPADIMNDLPVADLDLADVVVAPISTLSTNVDVLIGADYYWEMVTGNVRRLNRSLVAVDTDFGWTLQGVVPHGISAVTCSTVTVLRANVRDTNSSLSAQLRSFWELESMGIQEQEPRNGCEDNVMSSFTSSIAFKDNQYEVSLPWKDSSYPLTDNAAIAGKRLTSLRTKLEKNDSMFRQYDTAIRSYLEQGFAEKVPENEMHDPEKKIYYMPHRAVLRPDSATTKIRVVFDASSHAPGCLSLNDALETGPNLNPDLLKVILNFRKHQVALCADIEKAFLQIALRQEDRDALRFFWYRDPPVRGTSDSPVEVWRMTRVPFGAASSPFLLAAAVRHHLASMEPEFPSTTTKMRECLYVDDLITGAESKEDALQFYREALQVMDQAGMKLRKWSSNCGILQKTFEEDGTGSVVEQVECPTSDVTRVLGLVWNRIKDELTFSLQPVLEFLTLNCNTKRFILQASARIFDPLGLIAPVTVTCKIMFQSLWELGVDWDAPLPEDLAAKWTEWHSRLYLLADVMIPRRYSMHTHRAVHELHIFVDASPKAYGAAAYLRTESELGTNVTLVMSKTRVAPLKKLSLPRLELMGALIGARIKQYLTESISDIAIETTHLWTDSTIVLHWVRGSAKQWKPFVNNRVTEIQARTDPSSWNHCPGNNNPADLLTRGVTPEALVHNETWWSGPAWLSQSSVCWPRSIVPTEMTSVDEERRSVLVHHIATQENDFVIPVQRYGTLTKALRVTAWAQRFITNSRSPAQKQEGPLTAMEISGAQQTLVHQAQHEGFQEEIRSLHHSKRFANNSPLRDLNVFLDKDGILRVGGRLEHSQFSYEEKHPIVLPNGHHLTKLLIIATHKRLMHAGVLETITELREAFWIVRGRQMTKKLIRSCTTCDRFNSRAASQPVAPLPKDRVSQATPFEVTGVDFAGPLFARDRGQLKKSYIVIFTCATTRAIHLELTTDMTTENFLLAFRRFVSRRGLCRVIFSDNARTFQRASRDMTTIWKSLRGQKITDYLSTHQVQWKFIVERAAWWGGFWERMVRSVKLSLKKVLGHSFCNFEELTTLLTEVEAVLNSRPLTYVYTEASEPEPLTPAHFLVGKRLTAIPHSSGNEETGATPRELTRRLKYRQALFKRLWTRWQKEYLSNLRSAHYARPSSSRELKVNDIVLVHENLQPRLLWRTGRITEVFPGRDGRIRACKVQLPGRLTLKRPIQLLYPLESVNE